MVCLRQYKQRDPVPPDRISEQKGSGRIAPLNFQKTLVGFSQITEQDRITGDVVRISLGQISMAF